MSENLYNYQQLRNQREQLFLTKDNALVRRVGTAQNGKALVLPYGARREEPVEIDEKELKPASVD
jgi:hypothetical protein